MKYLGVVSAPVFWLAFIGIYTGSLASLRGSGIFFLFLIPALTLLSVWTHGFQGPIWQEIWPQWGKTLASHDPLLRPWLWIHAGYSFLLILIGSFFLLRQTAGSGLLSHRRTGVVLLMSLAPLAGNMAHIFAQPFISWIDPAPLGFGVSGLAVVLGLPRRKKTDLLRIAQDYWFKSTPDAVFVLDPKNHIAAVNPKAEALLEEPVWNIVGKSVYDLYSPGAEILKRFGGVDDLSSEICWGPSDSPQYFDLKISPLVDSRGTSTGRLLFLRELTSRKQIETDLHKIQGDLEKLVRQRTLELQVTNQRLMDEVRERRQTQAILKESEERYRQLVEQPFDGVYVLRGGNIVYINHAGATFLGAEKPSQIIGMSVLDFVHPEYKAFVENRLRTLSRGEKMVPLAEEKFIRLDGKEMRSRSPGPV